MGERKREPKKKLQVRRERLRVLDLPDLDRVAGGHSMARSGSRLCITPGNEP